LCKSRHTISKTACCMHGSLFSHGTNQIFVTRASLFSLPAVRDVLYSFGETFLGGDFKETLHSHINTVTDNMIAGTSSQVCKAIHHQPTRRSIHIYPSNCHLSQTQYPEAKLFR
jgi:hypothetical protein